MTVSVDLAVPRRAVAIGAHPDDIEFGAGATLAKWAAGGCDIFHVVCTDGSKGSWDPDEDTARLVALRQDEQRAASRELGGRGEVVFLGWPDGELECGLRQRWEVAYWLRKLRPDVVLGHDPWRRYRLHPDHRNAGFLATDGIVAARDPHFFPEQGEPPHRPQTLLLWESEEPDHVESATEQTMAAKVAALLAHRSQFRSTMRIEDPGAGAEIDAFRKRIVDRLAEHGTRAGVPSGEGFKIMRDL
jgi:LmbE family N-acetylglucosaminyl deacetylase